MVKKYIKLKYVTSYTKNYVRILDAYFHLVLKGLYAVRTGKASGFPSANTWQVTYKSEQPSW